MIQNKFLIVCFLLLRTLICQAQQSEISPVIKFDNITMEDGLAINVVPTILEDTRGFIWFGTVNGLHRYDGYECKIYRKDIKDSLTLLGNSIEALFMDEEGHIWVGTGKGLSRFNPKTEQFTNYEHDENMATSLSDNHIRAITQDSFGNLIIGLNNGGINVFEKESSIFSHYPPDYEDTLAMLPFPVSQIKKDHLGNIWIGTFGGGLYHFDQQSRHFKRIGDKNDPLNWIHSMYEFYNGIFEVADGAKHIDIINKTWTDGDSSFFSAEQQKYIYENRCEVFEGPNMEK